MKSKATKLFLLVLFISATIFSQTKVKEKDILGVWTFHLDLNKEIEKETKNSDGFEKLFVTGILKGVNKLVKRADIKFHFKKNHTLTVTHNSSLEGSEETIEYHKWKINKKGKLVTSNIKNENLKFNTNNGWMLRKGKLVSVDENDEVEENVWMKKVK